jgi:hypothetical protein
MYRERNHGTDFEKCALTCLWPEQYQHVSTYGLRLASYLGNRGPRNLRAGSRTNHRTLINCCLVRIAFFAARVSYHRSEICI